MRGGDVRIGEECLGRGGMFGKGRDVWMGEGCLDRGEIFG